MTVEPVNGALPTRGSGGPSEGGVEIASKVNAQI